VCWNCGKEGHCLSKCKKPHNNKRINFNKKAFLKHQHNDAKARKKGKTKEQGLQRGKWAPPGQGESDRKVIDSKPHAFNPQTKQWDIVSTAHDPNVATPAPPTQNRTNKQTEVAGQPDNAMIAMTEQIGNAHRGLQDTLRQA
jgi:hypothetical protein